jgi:hypothetical protein
MESSLTEVSVDGIQEGTETKNKKQKRAITDKR